MSILGMAERGFWDCGAGLVLLQVLTLELPGNYECFCSWLKSRTTLSLSEHSCQLPGDSRRDCQPIVKVSENALRPISSRVRGCIFMTTNALSKFCWRKLYWKETYGIHSAWILLYLLHLTPCEKRVSALAMHSLLSKWLHTYLPQPCNHLLVSSHTWQGSKIFINTMCSSLWSLPIFCTCGL